MCRVYETSDIQYMFIKSTQAEAALAMPFMPVPLNLVPLVLFDLPKGILKCTRLLKCNKQASSPTTTNRGVSAWERQKVVQDVRKLLNHKQRMEEFLSEMRDLIEETEGI